MPSSRIRDHVIKTELDHQRGGWVWTCSCGGQSKRPSWYKARALASAEDHLEKQGAAGDGAPTNQTLAESGGGSY